MNITKIAIERPVTALMFFAGIVLLGIISLRQLSVDLLPDINYPRLSVMTQYAGVAPEEIESLITAPLEAAVSRIPGLRRVESTSKEGVSFITLEFAWGTDMDFTMLHAREALDSFRDRLPAGAEKPSIISLDPKSEPIMVLAVSGEGSLLDVKELTAELIKPRLEQIEGVGMAEITGGVEREIQVDINSQLLSLYGLTVSDVAASIDSYNRNLQGGTIRKGMFKYSIRVVGQYESLKEIGEIGLKATKEKGLVRLSDIATIKDAIKERQGITRLDRRDSIGLHVYKDAGANTVKVSHLIKKGIALIKKENPKLSLTIVSEQAGYIEAAITAVTNEIIQGAILVFLVVLIFLQEWKTPLIIMSALIISIVGAFNLLYFSNITLNIMSLGGLALGIGMLDDCLDVISENIFRHRGMGKSPAEAAYQGTREVTGAMVTTSFSMAVVFLPIVYVHGIAGQLFKDAALTVTFSLLSALLLSLTMLPMLQARQFGLKPGDAMPLGRPTKSFAATPASWRLWRVLSLPLRTLHWLLYRLLSVIRGVLTVITGFVLQSLALVFRYLRWPVDFVLQYVFRAFNFVYFRFVVRYKKWLEWSLDHKGRVLWISLLFFAVTFFLGSQVKREHMPKVEATAFKLRINTPVDYSLDQTSAIAAEFERELQTLRGVKLTFAQIGIVSGMKTSADVSLNTAQIYAEVAQPEQLEPVLDGLRKKLAAFPDVSYTIARDQSTLAEFLAFANAEIALKIKGNDLTRLTAISHTLVAKLKNVGGIIDLNTNIGEGKPEFRIRLRKDALGKYPDLSPASVSDFLVNAVRGKVASQFSEMEKKYDILVRFDESSRATIDRLLDAQIPYKATAIPLKELVDCQQTRGPLEIRRENQQREVIVTANLHGAKISQVMPTIERIIRQSELPEGYQIVISGEQEEMNKSFKSLILAILLAVLLTYMIMAAQFESLLHPFLVMLTLPMGAAGAFVSLYFSGQTLNVISIIGMVVLVGLVVDDAIVEIDFINHLRKEGKNLREAVMEGCMTRLRAILMASLDTAIGLVPMALGLERGSELLRPLGVVVFGGLLFSTFLTLIQIPVVYEWVEHRRSAVRGMQTAP